MVNFIGHCIWIWTNDPNVNLVINEIGILRSYSTSKMDLSLDILWHTISLISNPYFYSLIGNFNSQFERILNRLCSKTSSNPTANKKRIHIHSQNDLQKTDSMTSVFYAKPTLRVVIRDPKLVLLSFAAQDAKKWDAAGTPPLRCVNLGQSALDSLGRISRERASQRAGCDSGRQKCVTVNET